jgi:hypothetical protein
MEILDRIEQKVDEAIGSLARIEQHDKDSDQRIHDLETTVYGNGKPGLKADTGELQTTVTTIKKFCESQHRPGAWARIWPTIVSSAVSVIIVAALLAMLHLWKIH